MRRGGHNACSRQEAAEGKGGWGLRETESNSCVVADGRARNLLEARIPVSPPQPSKLILDPSHPWFPHIYHTSERVFNARQLSFEVTVGEQEQEGNGERVRYDGARLNMSLEGSFRCVVVWFRGEHERACGKGGCEPGKTLDRACTTGAGRLMLEPRRALSSTPFVPHSWHWVQKLLYQIAAKRDSRSSRSFS